MKKLITFGDSFAQYAWPMWPNLLAQSFDLTENYGQPGCGNFFIFNSFVSHMLSSGISQSDTVIIEWTEPTRLDYIADRSWVCEGIRSAELLIENNLGQYVSDEVTSLQQLTMMSVVAQILDKSKCDWYFIFLNDASIPRNKFDLKPDIENRFEIAQNSLSLFKNNVIDYISMTTFFEKLNMPIIDCINSEGNPFKDPHPTPTYTMRFLEDILGKHMEIDSINKIREFASYAEHEIEQRKENSVMNQPKIGEFFSASNLAPNFKSPQRPLI